MISISHIFEKFGHILVTHTFLDLLLVSLQVPGARSGKIRLQNEIKRMGALERAYKMEYLLCEHLYLKMDIMPSRKDFRIDDVTGKS